MTTIALPRPTQVASAGAHDPTATGLTALVGGQEHQPGCEPIDRMLLAPAATSRPHVVVLLAASPVRRRLYKAREAHTYWARHGAGVHVGCAGRPGDLPATISAIERADLVVLTGGRPWLLHRRLDRSPMLDALRQRWAGGMPVAGSSSGAMAFAAWRLWPTPGSAYGIRPGYGMAPGMVVPHHYRRAAPRLTDGLAAAHPALPILSIADRTALVGSGERFTVAGTGNVLLRYGQVARYGQHGDQLTLPSPLAAPALAT